MEPIGDRHIWSQIVIAVWEPSADRRKGPSCRNDEGASADSIENPQNSGPI